MHRIFVVRGEVGKIITVHGNELMTFTSSCVEAMWWVSTPDGHGVPMRSWFSDLEIERVMSLKRVQDRRTRFLAHCLAKKMMCDHVRGLSNVDSIICHEPSGRPLSRCGMELSISHSVVGAAAAVAHSRMVGVDIEDMSRAVDMPTVRDLLCSNRELDILAYTDFDDVELLRLWTCKEALVKVGVTTLGEFSQIDLSGMIRNNAVSAPMQTRVSGSWRSLIYRDFVLASWRDDMCVGAVAYSVD